MSQTTGTQAPDFIAYEYTTVQTSRDLESLYRDTYVGFGWIVEGYGSSIPGAPGVTLKLKRDRHIHNRAAVVALQRRAEQALAEIARLERSKSVVATGTSITIGIVGSAFLAGSVFSLDAGATIASIALGAVGLIAWVAGYVAHGRVRARQIARLTGPIDAQYDIVYQAGEEAARLLA
ncbi:MAG TPA: hypothetical protein VGC67_13590 [Cellulomonas sp.]